MQAQRYSRRPVSYRYLEMPTGSNESEGAALRNLTVVPTNGKNPVSLKLNGPLTFEVTADFFGRQVGNAVPEVVNVDDISSEAVLPHPLNGREGQTRQLSVLWPQHFEKRPGCQVCRNRSEDVTSVKGVARSRKEEALAL